MRLLKTVAAALFAGGALVGTSWGQYSPALFSFTNVGVNWQAQNLNGAAIPPGTYSTLAVSAQWSVSSGSPFSANARSALFRVDRSGFSTNPPSGGDIYWTSRAASGSATNTQPATLVWTDELGTNYSGGQPIFFHARGTADGTANWANITLTLGGYTLPPPPSNDQCDGAMVIPSSALANVGDSWLSPGILTMGATEDGDLAPNCAFNGVWRRGIWFKYTAPDLAEIELSTCSADAPLGNRIDTVLAVFTSSTGDCTGTFANFACNDDAGPACTGTRASIVFTPYAGRTYFILVYSWGIASPTGTPPETMQLRATKRSVIAAPPPNDQCAGAMVIPSSALANVGDSWLSPGIVTASASEIGDPLPSCTGSTRRGIWFTFTASQSAIIRLSTCFSGPEGTPLTNVSDTVLAVYTSSTGNCTGPFTQVACNDDSGPACSTFQASLNLQVSPNVTYYILVYAFGSGHPSIFPLETMQVRATRVVIPPPANDTCTGAVIIPPSALTNTGDSWLSPILVTAGATEAGDPSPYCTPIWRRGVWYTLTSPENMGIEISTCEDHAPGGNRSDPVLTVFTSTTGGCAGPFSPVACNDDSGPACSGIRASIRFNVNPGTTYYILVYSYGANPAPIDPIETTQIRVMRLGLQVPPNDTCSGAIPIPTEQLTEAGSSWLSEAIITVAATGDSDPVPACAESVSRGIWFRYRAPFGARVRVSTCQSDAPGGNRSDTVLAVFQSQSDSFVCNIANQPIACNDDGGSACFISFRASLDFLAHSNTTYFILVYSYGISEPSVNPPESLQIRVTNLQVLPLPPTNSTCFGAIDISAAANPVIIAGGTYVSTPANFLGSREQAIVPSSCSPINAPAMFSTMYYTFTPEVSGVYTLSVGTVHTQEHNARSMVAALYAGSSCFGLSLIACVYNGVQPPAGLQITTSLNAGTTYTLVLARATGQITASEDMYQFALHRFSPPPDAFQESEPNDSKYSSNEFTFSSCSNTITGRSTGSSFTVPGDASADNFLITLPANPGIVKWVATVDSHLPGHRILLRGLNQSGGVIVAGSDVILIASSGEPGSTLLFYTHGGISPRVYLSVTGTTATTSPYIIRFTCTPVTTIDVPGFFAPGSITITSANQGHTTDTDLWVYDAQVNAIPEFGNDDTPPGPGGTPPSNRQSTLTRTYAPGTYTVSIAPYNLANHLGAPPDDFWTWGPVTDFPGVTATSSIDPNVNCTLTITDSMGSSVQVPNTRELPHEINWIRFTVGTPVTQCNPADIAQTDATPGPDNCVDNGDFQLFVSAFFTADCPNCGQPASVACNPSDIAQTDATPGSDGCVNNGDFQLFIGSFFTANCPSCGN